MTALDDVRGALRQWKARPLFAVLVTATLGLSLGLATTAFSLFDAILLRPLPFPESERLVRVHTFSTQAPQSLHGASLPDFEDWERRARSLATMAAWITMPTHLTGQGPARTVRTTFATPQLFAALGVRPILGRMFGEDADRQLDYCWLAWPARSRPTATVLLARIGSHRQVACSLPSSRITTSKPMISSQSSQPVFTWRSWSGFGIPTPVSI